MPAKLTLYLPERPSRRVDLQPGATTVVGRAASADIVLADTRVSRTHGRLTWHDGACVLEDVGSKNGTFVNGERRSTASLQNGDWISFGGVVARFDSTAGERGEDSHVSQPRGTVHATPPVDSSPSGPALLQHLLISAMQLTRGERGVVLVAGPDGRILPEVACGFAPTPQDDEPFAGSASAIERALGTGSSIVISDAQHDGFFSKRQSVIEGGLATLACVPLRTHRGIAGLLYVDGRSTLDGFTELDLQILEAIAEQAALVLATMCVTRDLHEIVRTLPAPLSREMAGLRRRIGELAMGGGAPPATSDRAVEAVPGGEPRPAAAL